MANFETNIDYEGIELTINYDWVDGYPETLLTPMEYAEVENINEVYHNGEDIIYMLSDKTIENIKDAVYEAVYDEHNN